MGAKWMTDLDYFISAIGHPLRREILRVIYENPGISYSQILTRVNISSGKLNFHLQRLERFLSQIDGQYRLSDEGLLMFHTLGILEQRLQTMKVTQPALPGLLIGRRIGAFLIDVLLIMTVLFIATDPTSLSLQQAWWLPGISLPAFINRMVEILIFFPDVNAVLVRAYIIAFLWMYFTILEGYRGQSLGKIIFRIRVVEVSGARMTLHEAAIRALTKVMFLPIDIIAGLVKARKTGFLRYFGYYTRTWVVKV